jgi:hypothetical protein
MILITPDIITMVKSETMPAMTKVDPMFDDSGVSVDGSTLVSSILDVLALITNGTVMAPPITELVRIELVTRRDNDPATMLSSDIKFTVDV